MTILRLLRQWYHTSSVGQFSLALPRRAYHFYLFHMVPEERFLKWRFKESFGRELDLVNPLTFNEKIQWLKLYDRTPLHTQCADKYAVREYVKKKVGQKYLVPLLYHTEEASDIRSENLPDPPFIIKTTHGSLGGIIVRDKSSTDWPTVRRTLRRHLRKNHYYETKEWQYRHIKPSIIVERLISTEFGVVPIDYKIYCFRGTPCFVQVIIGRYVQTQECFYTTDWRPLDFTLTYPLVQHHLKAPEQLGEMLEVAQALSEDFYYARVDLYNEHGKVYFGEITHHPDSGFSCFDPPEWDQKLGRMLEIPVHKHE